MVLMGLVKGPEVVLMVLCRNVQSGGKVLLIVVWVEHGSWG